MTFLFEVSHMLQEQFHISYSLHEKISCNVKSSFLYFLIKFGTQGTNYFFLLCQLIDIWFGFEMKWWTICMQGMLPKVPSPMQ